MNHSSALTLADTHQTQGRTLRGQTLLVDGLGEHSGRYGDVIQHLNERSLMT